MPESFGRLMSIHTTSGVFQEFPQAPLPRSVAPRSMSLDAPRITSARLWRMSASSSTMETLIGIIHYYENTTAGIWRSPIMMNRAVFRQTDDSESCGSQTPGSFQRNQYSGFRASAGTSADGAPPRLPRACAYSSDHCRSGSKKHGCGSRARRRRQTARTQHAPPWLESDS